jgi:DNA-binding transcriptional MerR regulator
LKNKIGQRLYKDSDIQLILRIKKLLYEDKYTMAGTKRVIKMDGKKKQPDSSDEILLNALNEQVAGLRWILDFMRTGSR